ncbi:MAG TPA: glycosyltransferase family 4 protein [Flavisolibacter sp.]|nr:glycosyltransferase family 4 protein [Flavisolibacter sp.]
MRTKKVLVVCPYPENVAPSQRLKFEQYYTHFREAGYTVETSAFISPSFWKIIYKKGNYAGKALHTIAGYFGRVAGLFRLHRYDVVYIHLWVTPFGPPFFEWLYRRFSKKIVYDIDDMVYLDNIRNKAHPFVSMIKGTKKPIFLMKHADHVITCTPYLDEFVRQHNRHTTDISSTINTRLYRAKTDYTVKDKFTIGWSGSHSTSRYLHLLDDVFRELAKEIDFRLLVMGDTSFSLDGVDVESLPWKEEHEVDVISRFDIGLYPLPNEQWVFGKSGLKALQYMALGIPTVATAIGTIFRIIQNGENGLLVNEKEEWKKAILALYYDQDLREKMGRRAVQTVHQAYSVDANKQTYTSILDNLLSSNP